MKDVVERVLLEQLFDHRMVEDRALNEMRFAWDVFPTTTAQIIEHNDAVPHANQVFGNM